MLNKFFLGVLLFTVSSHIIFGQTVTGNGQPIDHLGRDSARIISTAVPFLTISPDARSGALGDAGVAISPDANAIYWNPAKLAFIEKDMGFTMSYNPWLRKLVNDMALMNLAGYKKLRKEEAIGIALRYFDLGQIDFTDQSGNPTGTARPNEYSIGTTYSRKLSENLGVAVGLKFIHSNLGGSLANLNTNGTQVKPGNSASADVGVYYRKDVVWNGRNTNLAFGANISDVGRKISYTNNNEARFIPTNLRVGTAVTTELDPYNKFTFILDANKLMVPSTPVYNVDASGNPTGEIIRGKDPNRPLISGILGSFADAPDGFKEELREVMLSLGVEYWYNEMFAGRFGFFHESKYKGNRNYFTFGLGLRYQVFGVDFAYLIPLNLNNPLAETLRIALHFDFEGKAKQESITE